MIPLRLLFYNTYLLRAGRLPWPAGDKYAHAVPGVDARAKEIGARLGGRYDVAALCEVFDQRERRSMMLSWQRRADGSRIPAHAVTGPPAIASRVPLVKTSGLFTVVEGPRVVRSESHRYRFRGTRFLDSDAWAHKGALLVEVDVGAAANLEVYSTHLIWGGDLLVKRDREHRSVVADTRQAQSHEMLDFVRRTHRPGNASLLVGDFNIDALHPGDAYADLTRAMDDAGFEDVWETHGTGPGPTCDLRLSGPAIAEVDPDAPDLCLDHAEDGPARAEGKRIDYAWLRRPRDGAQVSVEVTAIRRACFPREPGVHDYDALAYLSDHIGLHLELALS